VRGRTTLRTAASPPPKDDTGDLAFCTALSEQEHPALAVAELTTSITTSARMSAPSQRSSKSVQIPSELANWLGVRRTMILRRIIKQSGLPVEVVLDLALELLDIASRKLAPSPINRQAVGLGTARWRNVAPQERSEALRKAAQARWAKPRRNARAAGDQTKK
jgi:hypothetical protein